VCMFCPQTPAHRLGSSPTLTTNTLSLCKSRSNTICIYLPSTSIFPLCLWKMVLLNLEEAQVTNPYRQLYSRVLVHLISLWLGSGIPRISSKLQGRGPICGAAPARGCPEPSASSLACQHSTTRAEADSRTLRSLDP
jgi:hypothetical protein